MNLYLLTQSQENGYDTYDSCVVCAENEDKARLIRPRGDWGGSYSFSSRCWARTPDNVKVEFIGVASPSVEEGVVLASFNAG